MTDKISVLVLSDRGLMSRLVQPYDKRFYQSQQDGSLRSAEIILPLVDDLIHPSNVLDVGCGVGTWLST